MANNENINEIIPLGTVLRIYVQDTMPPKIKILVVVGIDNPNDTLATIFINSELRPRNLSSTELQALQLSLQPSTCPFLEHESCADCSEIRERSISEITKLLKQDPKRKMAVLAKTQLEEVLALLRKAKTISIALKKKYKLTY